MRSRRHLAWAMAVLVLCAQLGAQAHAYSHLASAGNAAQHHLRTLPCLECNSCAPLLALAGGFSSPLALAAADPASVIVQQSIVPHLAEACRAYRSRAPPVPS